MKHAGSEALDALSDLIEKLRTLTGLAERKPGIFYAKGKAFLHFHEDRAGLFADLREHREWLRFPVNDLEDRERLLAFVVRMLAGKTVRS